MHDTLKKIAFKIREFFRPPFTLTKAGKLLAVLLPFAVILLVAYILIPATSEEAGQSPIAKRLRLTATPTPTPTATPSAAPTASAEIDYYVSPSGNDSNSGKESSKPLRTIQKALDTAQPGETIQLAEGNYKENVVTKRSGTASEPITITGPRSAVLTGIGSSSRTFEINHDYIILDGFTINGKSGDGSSQDDYNNKLIYVHGKQANQGPKGIKILNMLITNAGGECIRLRYFVTHAEIAYNTITNCGVKDFVFDGGGKNGEGIYVGTSSTQWNDGKNPTDGPDITRDNRIHHNTINTQGNECVDIKEGSVANVVEHNDCTGQKDENSAGLDSRSDDNTFRKNKSYGNAGAGIRLGGHTVDGITYGKNNNIYENEIRDNKKGGIKFQVTPQGKVCGNTMSGNDGGDAVGTYGSAFKDKVTEDCS